MECDAGNNKSERRLPFYLRPSHQNKRDFFRQELPGVEKRTKQNNNKKTKPVLQAGEKDLYVKKNVKSRFYKQNNNSARALHFFVFLHFFAVFERLQGKV